MLYSVELMSHCLIGFATAKLALLSNSTKFFREYFHNFFRKIIVSDALICISDIYIIGRSDPTKTLLSYPCPE